jgi:hypothetical protein
MGDWKGIRKNIIKDSKAAWELYNLSTDPQEKNNIAYLHKDMLDRFNAIVKKEHQHPVVNDWEVIDRVK